MNQILAVVLQEFYQICCSKYWNVVHVVNAFSSCGERGKRMILSMHPNTNLSNISVFIINYTQISQNPESFVKTKPLPFPPSPPPEAGAEGGQPSSEAGGTFLSSLLSPKTPPNTTRGAEDNFHISTTTYQEEGRGGDDSDEEGFTIVSRVFTLTPEDFFHLECVKIIDKMKRTEAFMPPSFKLLIATIFRLTVKTSDFSSRHATPAWHVSGDKESGEGDGDVSVVDEKKKHQKYESKAEHGVYYSSSCATLFLRLICPALLCPLEWGVLSQKTLMNFQPKKLQQQQQQQSSLSVLPVDGNKDKKREILKRFVFGRKKSSTSSNDTDDINSEVAENDQSGCILDMNTNPAAAAIILVAHILNSCNLEEFWSSNDFDLDNFQQIQSNVVRVVPIEKVITSSSCQ
jgi:hypothetical protein